MGLFWNIALPLGCLECSSVPPARLGLSSAPGKVRSLAAKPRSRNLHLGGDGITAGSREGAWGLQGGEAKPRRAQQFAEGGLIPQTGIFFCLGVNSHCHWPAVRFVHFVGGPMSLRSFARPWISSAPPSSSGLAVPPSGEMSPSQLWSFEVIWQCRTMTSWAFSRPCRPPPPTWSPSSVSGK